MGSAKVTLVCHRRWPFNRKGWLSSLTTLSDLTCCFVVQKLHKQTVGQARWLARWCFSHGRRAAPREPVPRGESTMARRHPQAALGGSIPLGSPGCLLHRKQRAWLMYMSPCGLWSQPHPTFESAQATRATGNGQGYIYSHIVFIQRCCFAQIIMSFFSGRGHGICLFRRAS